VLIVLGLFISIPLIVFGSTLILRVLNRFPQIAFIGGALLGFISGDIVITDPALAGYLEPYMGWLPWVAPAAGAALVLSLGLFFKRRAERRQQVKT
jgi:predicted tellurium resistance membrane protein TerC